MLRRKVCDLPRMELAWLNPREDVSSRGFVCLIALDGRRLGSCLNGGLGIFDGGRGGRGTLCWFAGAIGLWREF